MAKIIDFKAKKKQKDEIEEIYLKLQLERMKRFCNRIFEPTQPQHKELDRGE